MSVKPVHHSWGNTKEAIPLELRTFDANCHLSTQIEEVEFCMKALPRAFVGGKKNLSPSIYHELKPGYKPNIVILHVGTNYLAF